MRFFRRVVQRIMMRPSKVAFCVRTILGLSAADESYYPDKPQKKRIRQIWDLITWYFENKEINPYYNLYGFDLVEKTRSEMSRYQNNKSFKMLRSQGNRNSAANSQIVLLRDKYLFFRYMKGNHLPVPEVFAERINGVLRDNELNIISAQQVMDRGDYFVKAIDGECGEYVKHIRDFEEYNLFSHNNQDIDYILQERVIQHPELARLNPNAVNTIRIITVMTKSGPKLFGALLRVGTKASQEKDNTSQGGIAVGILEDGTLTEFGIRKPKYGGRTDHHPDSGVYFSSFRIPYFEDAVKISCKAHEYFYRIKSIGWDVAITENGPVFIEGNDNWELQSLQALYGGMREKCNSDLK